MQKHSYDAANCPKGTPRHLRKLWHLHMVPKIAAIKKQAPEKRNPQEAQALYGVGCDLVAKHMNDSEHTLNANHFPDLIWLQSVASKNP